MAKVNKLTFSSDTEVEKIMNKYPTIEEGITALLKIWNDRNYSTPDWETANSMANFLWNTEKGRKADDELYLQLTQKFGEGWDK